MPQTGQRLSVGSMLTLFLSASSRAASPASRASSSAESQSPAPGAISCVLDSRLGSVSCALFLQSQFVFNRLDLADLALEQPVHLLQHLHHLLLQLDMRLTGLSGMAQHDCITPGSAFPQQRKNSTIYGSSRAGVMNQPEKEVALLP